MIISEEALHPRLKNSSYESGENAENIIYKPEYLDRVLAFEDRNPITKILKDVPHYELQIPHFDINRALEELKLVENDFEMFNLLTPAECKISGSRPHPYWGGRSLVNYSFSSREFFCKQSKESSASEYGELQPLVKNLSRQPTVQDMMFYPTELWVQMPYITSFIKTYISDNLYRTWLWQIKANGYLNWHNHAQLPWDMDRVIYDRAIVHIPLITNPETRMLIKKNGKIYAEHYAAGEAWVFNAVHYHAVDNFLGAKDRVHLTIFCPFEDKKFKSLLEQSFQSRAPEFFIEN